MNAVATMSHPPQAAATRQVEIIDTGELARRLGLPKSWIAAHTRGRATDVIPHLKFGRYVRFRWGTAELEKWLQDHEASR